MTMTMIADIEATPRKRINTGTTTDTATASGMDAKRRARTIRPISARAITTAPRTATRDGWDPRIGTGMDIAMGMSADTGTLFTRATGAAAGGAMAIMIATIACTSERTGRDA